MIPVMQLTDNLYNQNSMIYVFNNHHHQQQQQQHHKASVTKAYVL